MWYDCLCIATLLLLFFTQHASSHLFLTNCLNCHFNDILRCCSSSVIWQVPFSSLCSFGEDRRECCYSLCCIPSILKCTRNWIKFTEFKIMHCAQPWIWVSKGVFMFSGLVESTILFYPNLQKNLTEKLMAWEGVDSKPSRKLRKLSIKCVRETINTGTLSPVSIILCCLSWTASPKSWDIMKLLLHSFHFLGCFYEYRKKEFLWTSWWLYLLQNVLHSAKMHWCSYILIVCVITMVKLFCCS